jgi:hypothetical protein
LTDSSFNAFFNKFLEHVLCSELEESRIGRVVLELLRASNLTAARTIISGRWTIPGLGIEKVKGIRTELDVLLAPRLEVFVRGHISTLISGPVDLV